MATTQNFYSPKTQEVENKKRERRHTYHDQAKARLRID